MVDNGVLRLNEGQQVNDMLNKHLGVNLTVVDASELFLSRLDGVEDPEQKRKIIGNTFINVFEAEAAKIEEAAEKEEKNGAEAKGKIEWLLQGSVVSLVRQLEAKVSTRKVPFIRTSSRASASRALVPP
jgi:GMP synthase (glutamine-hydrolysing)